MSDVRAAAMAHVQYWPSPVHAAILTRIAADSYKEPDPQAPDELTGWIRVRTSQLELSESLGTSTKTVRRTFADFDEMRVLRRSPDGRTWYLNPHVDNTKDLAEHMLKWKRFHEQPADLPDDALAWPDTAPLDAVGVASTNGHAHRPAAPPEPPQRPLDRLLDPTQVRPNREVRFANALAMISDRLGFIPADVSEWWKQYWHDVPTLIAYFESNPEGMKYQSLEEWLEEMRPYIREYVGHD